MCRCAGVRLMGVDCMCENARVCGCVKTRVSMIDGEQSQISKDPQWLEPGFVLSIGRRESHRPIRGTSSIRSEVSPQSEQRCSSHKGGEESDPGCCVNGNKGSMRWMGIRKGVKLQFNLQTCRNEKWGH